MRKNLLLIADLNLRMFLKLVRVSKYFFIQGKETCSHFGNNALYWHHESYFKKTLRDFGTRHPDSMQQLLVWYKEMELGNWSNHNELKADYPKASKLKNNRVVFNIHGNSFRVIVKIN